MLDPVVFKFDAAIQKHANLWHDLRASGHRARERRALNLYLIKFSPLESLQPLYLTLNKRASFYGLLTAERREYWVRMSRVRSSLVSVRRVVCPLAMAHDKTVSDRLRTLLLLLMLRLFYHI